MNIPTSVTPKNFLDTALPPHPPANLPTSLVGPMPIETENDVTTSYFITTEAKSQKLHREASQGSLVAAIIPPGKDVEITTNTLDSNVPEMIISASNNAMNWVESQQSQIPVGPMSSQSPNVLTESAASYGQLVHEPTMGLTPYGIGKMSVVSSPQTVLSGHIPTETKGEEPKVPEIPEEERPPLNYFQLYRYADRKSIFFMVLASIAAMLNGAVLPLMNLVISNASQIITAWAADPNQYTAGDLLYLLISRIIGLVLLGILTLVAGYIQTYTWCMSAENQTMIIRKEYFRAVLGQEMEWLEKTPSGELINRISTDINVIYDGMAEKIGLIFQFSTSFVIGMVLAFVTGWRLALIMLACFPLPAYLLRWMWERVAADNDKITNTYSIAGAQATQTFRSIPTVVASNGQQIEQRHYDSFLDDVFVVAKRIAKNNAIGIACVSFLWYAIKTPVFYFGGVWVLDGVMTTGDAMNTFLQISGAAVYLQSIMGWLTSLGMATGAGRRVFDTIERRPKIDATGLATRNILQDQVQQAANVEIGLVPKVPLGGNIEFQNVSFSYPSRKDVPILRGLSFSIKPGQSVALVGPSGSGKSTTVQLLQRIYDPDGGQVLVDGVPLTDYNVTWLRQQMAIVSQEPVLFPISIERNVALGVPTSGPCARPAPSKDEIVDALTTANAIDFVKKLPDGLDTIVYGGTSLSGGQKQRLAIARAVVRKPRVLLLDEATSALDTRSERLVQDALTKISKQDETLTTLIIAHRLSTIKHCDVILVLQDGRLVEQGNHATLMAKQGIYASMVAMQQVSGSSETVTSPPAVESPTNPTLPHYDTLSPEDTIILPKKPERSATMNVSLKSDDGQDPWLMAVEDLTAKEDEQKKLEEEKEKAAKYRGFPWQRLWQASQPYMFWLTIGFIGALMDGCLTPIESTLMGINLGVYSDPAAFGGYSGVLLYSLLFLALGAWAFVCKILVTLGFGIGGAQLAEKLRSMAFHAIVNKDMYFFDQEENSPGTLATRLANDPDSIKRFTGAVIGSFVSVTVNMVAGFVIAFIAGWQLTLVLIGASPLLFLAAAMEQRALQGFTAEVRKAYERAGQVASIALTNVRTVSAFSLEDTFCKLYEQSLQEPHAWRKKQSIAMALGSSAFQFCILMVFTIVFVACYFFITNYILEFARVTVVLLNVLLCSAAAGSVVQSARTIAEARVASNELFDMIDSASQIPPADPLGRGINKAIQGDIEFKDVQFAFPSRPDTMVLRGVNARLQAGSKVAFVGPSGSGKSTLAKLLQRLYDPNSGMVTIDGVDVKEWNLYHLRGKIGVVGQEPVLFDRTVRENIAYGKLGATDEEVEAAAKLAGVHGFVMKLPKGYDTPVGEMGSQFSGGQKQRIAIARACISQPRIMILDEATSALDSETEHEVQEALDAVSRNITTLVIAHRLKTIQNADWIYVLQDGEVVESGTHTSLLQENGIYKNMVLQQNLGAAVA